MLQNFLCRALSLASRKVVFHGSDFNTSISMMSPIFDLPAQSVWAA